MINLFSDQFRVPVMFLLIRVFILVFLANILFDDLKRLLGLGPLW